MPQFASGGLEAGGVRLNGNKWSFAWRLGRREFVGQAKHANNRCRVICFISSGCGFIDVRFGRSRVLDCVPAITLNDQFRSEMSEFR